MGGLLAVPTILASAFSLVAEKGLKYSFYYGLTYLYLATTKRFRKRRLDLYDFYALGQPERNSVLVPREEWALETPKENPVLFQDNDDVFCYGVNSKSESVVAQITREPNAQVLCSLFLRLEDGRIFTMPEEHSLQAEISEINTFGSSRFKFQCMAPMRRWRLFFNGLLRQKSEDGSSESEKLVHVKFTFTWTASADVFDFTSDLSFECLSNIVASSSSLFYSPKSILERIKIVLNCYEQPGMLFGTVNVAKEEEKEVYFWGLRGRYLGKTREFKKGCFEQVYASYQNGAIMHMGYVSLPELSNKVIYGFLMRSDGFIRPILDLREDETFSTDNKIYYSFTSSGKHHTLIQKSEDYDIPFHKQFFGNTTLKPVKMRLDNFKGSGFVFQGRIQPLEIQKAPNRPTIPANRSASKQMLCVPFQNEACQDSELTGGKGSSLGKLYAMSCETSDAPKFTVPNGIVVTTKAYSEFIKGSLQNSLDTFEKTVWSSEDGKISALCQKMADEVNHAVLPNNVIQAVITSLNQEFRDKLEESKFAVRSSATGEDTEQMSAAGQMETFLGLKGTEQILEAIIKCWSSQFAFQAVEYKRRYGQRLNTPMAVVIQEMIPCEVAGVCFTCDPFSGNPALISITANFGLGESVVSASAEPDTVMLERNMDDSLSMHSQQLGRKTMKIVMDGSGTKEVEVGEDASKCSISKEMSLLLGKIAVAIENRYGSSRDLEWGIIGDKIFLFQARPVTSLDLETEFETKHWYDTYMRSEKECFSKANVGEVMPRAHSPLGLDVMTRAFEFSFMRQRFIRWDGAVIPEVPYYAKKIVYAYNNVFFCMIDGFLGMEKDELSKSMMVSLFGREVDLSEMEKIAAERHTIYKKPSQSAISMILSTYLAKYLGGKWCRSYAEKNKDFYIPRSGENSSAEQFRILAEYFDLQSGAMNSHMHCTMASSIWNLNLFTLLTKARGDLNNDVYSDFAYLLSTCTDVESADIPAALQNLGKLVSKNFKAEEFRKMPADEALNWLQTTKTEAGVAFKSFLKRHGHRALKEFDVYTDTWGHDPRTLVSMLQSFVSDDMEGSHKKDVPSVSEILSKLHVPLDFWQRWNLRYMLPFCWRGVRDREFSKSLLIRAFNEIRKPLKTLSEIMVREGRLPKKELLFFLTLEEILQLINTRSPRLVAKAFHRWRVHDELDKLKFDEIMNGIPKPSNFENFVLDGDGVSMTGVPVSQGVVKATARVIIHLHEAATIQKGDILITYSTDIAWSPYFPLLSGVVTELGGLISHGAVVAREYGLPCVVGLHGATEVFKSGDIVILDGNKGTLTKVE